MPSPSSTKRPPSTPWRYLARYKLRVVVGACLILATNAIALTVPWLMGRVIDALTLPEPASTVAPLAVLMICCAVAGAVVRIGSRVALFNAARMAEYDLRAELFAHLVTLEPRFYRNHPTGDIMSRLASDVQTVRAMWGPGLLNLVNTSFLFAVALGLMIDMDPRLTLFALLPYPFVFLLGRGIGRYIYKASRGVQAQLGVISASLQEDLSGMGVIKTYTLESSRAVHFAALSQTLLGRNMSLVKIRGVIGPLMGGLASIGTVIVIWMGGRGVIEGRMDLGQMVQFNAYLALLLWPTMAIGWMISLFQRGLASWQRLTDILGTEPRITDGDAPAPNPDSLRGEITIRNLTVVADGRPILDDVSMTVPAGTTTAIVGRTGCGKSTLVDVLPRLLEIPSGTVFLDGHDITALPLTSLRGAIGYAPQEAFLFSRSIRDNIAFGYQRDGIELSESEQDQALTRATTAAGLARDLSAFPSGHDTLVGERGITLSGGQRQRVALARALATSPKLLILDDSLSSVDAETEREILEHLDDVIHGRTAILISHRITAIKRADQIVVLDEGRVVERGTHGELLAREGLYAELYRTQLEDEAVVSAEVLRPADSANAIDGEEG